MENNICFGLDSDFENYLEEKRAADDIEKYQADNEDKLIEYVQETKEVDWFVAASEVDRKKEKIQKKFIEEKKEEEYLENFTFKYEQLKDYITVFEGKEAEENPDQQEADGIDIFTYTDKGKKCGINLTRLLKVFILEDNVLVDNNVIYMWNGKYWGIRNIGQCVKNSRGQELLDADISISVRGAKDFEYNLKIEDHFNTKFRKINFDNNPLVVFKNGTLDYKNGVFYQDYFNKKDYCTIYLDFNFDINADYTDFNILMNSLNRQFNDTEDKTKLLNIYTLQEMMGLAISPETCKGVFFVKGQGDSGKTFFLNIIEEILKDTDNITNVDIQEFSSNNRFIKKELIGKTVNLGGDLSSTVIKDSIMKTLTGGDTIRAEQKCLNETIRFNNKCTHIFACNKMPANYEDKTSAYYNRMFIIPFDNVIPKKEQIEDYVILQEINKNINKAIAFALVGLCRYLKNNKKITQTKEMETQKQQYRRSNIPLVDFFEELIEFIPEEDMDVKGTVVGVTIKSLHRLYKKWDEVINDNNDYSLKQNNFREQIQEVFNINYKEDPRRGHCFMGIRLKPDIEENYLGAANAYIIKDMRLENKRTENGREGGAIYKK